MSEKLNIEIIDCRGTPWGRWFRAISMIAAIMVPGVLLENSAMQWLGFLLIVIVAIGSVTKRTARSMTVEEAIAHLEKMR